MNKLDLSYPSYNTNVEATDTARCDYCVV